MRRGDAKRGGPCLLVPALLLVAIPARAQVPAGPELHVNTYTSDIQQFPAVAADGAGTFIVAWHSQGNDGIGSGVFAQRYDASGLKLGGEFQVNSQTYLHQSFARVAAARRGDFVLAWTDTTPPGGDDIHARRFAASGEPRGGDFKVALSSLSERQVDVAMNATGAFVVVWARNPYGNGQGVAGRRYDAGGAPRGAEFRIDETTDGRARSPVVASDAAGNFVVAWEEYRNDWDIVARRYDASGAPLGAAFLVNSESTFLQVETAIASDAAGNFTVAWSGTLPGVRLQRYAASGDPLGGEARVDTAGGTAPALASDASGNFVVSWTWTDGGLNGIRARRFGADGLPRGAEFQVNSYTTGGQYSATVASDDVGNFLVTWMDRVQEGSNNFGVFAQRFGGLRPARLRVDTASNGVLEPGDSVDVRPSWRNVNGTGLAFAASAPAFTGPPATGVAYHLQDATGTYGTVANGATAECGDCYQVAVTFSGARPAQHWDASLTEHITPDTLGQTKPWPLHVGDSFVDVPRASPFYRFVETLLHQGVTGGCGGDAYCPAASTTREQMAVFVLVSKEGAEYVPPACATPVFDDVPASSPFCRWIEELARRGVVGGCGGGRYCPSDPVTREQMAVFVLRTLDPALDPPACTAPVFADVPASNTFCRWIEELARRGVVSGCGGGNYCPASPVAREQMGVFLAVTFGLELYG